MTERKSNPPRTATEELLLSTATDNAMGGESFPWLAGQKVYLEEKYFDSYDKEYALGLLRERLSSSGAMLVKSNEASVVVEVRSGALSTDNSTTLVGIPALTVPIPLAGAIGTPEIAIYKSDRADSVAKFRLFAYERNGRYIDSAAPPIGRAYLHDYKLIFLSWRKTDVPQLENAKKPDKERKNGNAPAVAQTAAGSGN